MNTEPVRNVDLSEVELERAQRQQRQHHRRLTQMHDDGRPLNGAPPTNRIKFRVRVGARQHSVARRRPDAPRRRAPRPGGAQAARAEAQLQRLDRRGSTPLNSALTLKLARSADEREIVDELLAAAKRLRGTGANVPDGNGWTPLPERRRHAHAAGAAARVVQRAQQRRRHDYYCQYATCVPCAGRRRRRVATTRPEMCDRRPPSATPRANLCNVEDLVRRRVGEQPRACVS